MELPGGSAVTIGSARPVTEGWTNAIAANPRILRCTADDGRTVVVKIRRPPGDPRRRDGFRREMAALLLLTELGSDAGPRLLATDDSAGLLVLEDLGSGPALDDLLVGPDPLAATRAFEALATTVGGMHAATLGQADGIGGWRFDLNFDVPGIGEVAEILSSGPMVLSTGDVAPQNCRLRDGRMRLLDFEDAAAVHPLLDAAQLRLPFAGAPCWSRIPPSVGARVEAAYRAAAGRPDDRSYAEGMAAATAAWTLIRLRRLPELLAADPPHPMGISRRGRLLDTLRTATDATGPVLPELATWFAATNRDLRTRWPDLPPAQPLYPAYRPDLRRTSG